MRLIGHRGARGEAPENTLSGFRHLRALGVRAVEFDIHLSADGELMVIHDAELSRTTSGHGLVREHSACLRFGSALTYRVARAARHLIRGYCTAYSNRHPSCHAAF